MTELVPIRKGKSTQVSLADLQERLDARQEVAETRSSVSTRKARVEAARRAFLIDPLETLVEIQVRASALVDVFDASITLEDVPLSQGQINKLSDELLQLERLKVELEALETRYRALSFAHLDETLPRIPGRPASQVPGKIAASSPGPHYIFERRGGNRKDPSLNTDTLREVLPPEVAAQIYVTIHHEAVPAYDEQVFDEGRFGELVQSQVIDLDVVAPHLTPGEWRTPSLHKTLVDGEH